MFGSSCAVGTSGSYQGPGLCFEMTICYSVCYVLHYTKAWTLGAVYLQRLCPETAWQHSGADGLLLLRRREGKERNGGQKHLV